MKASTLAAAIVLSCSATLPVALAETTTAGKEAKSEPSTKRIGLMGYYLGQVMSSCPKRSVPVTGPFARPGTTCEIRTLSNIAGQPVSSFFVSFAQSRVFRITAFVRGSSLEVRDGLSAVYGEPSPGGTDDYFWRLGDNAITLQSDGSVIAVGMVNRTDYSRERAQSVLESKSDL